MVSRFVFDPSQSGLRKTLKEYQELAIRYVWDAGADGVDSGQTWRHVKERLGACKSISQSSIINFLNRMVDEGVFSFRDATKKGGHYKIYFPLMNKCEYRKYLLRTIIESMMRDFPM